MPVTMSAKRETHLRAGAITGVVQQAGDPDRVNVYVDGAFCFGLAVEVAADAGLAPGMDLTVEAASALVARDAVSRARAAALNYLAAQARTAAELRRSLRRRGFEEHVAHEVVAWAEERRYVDDAEYARSYVRARFGGRGHGPARLRQELARRGVAREAVAAAIDEMLEEADVAEAAVDVARPRWRALAGETDPRRRRQKTLEFLVRRGFDYDDAREAVIRVAAEDGADDPGDEDAS
jgi:regulatory protein